ncbi:AbiEi antitoxin N-terminal domain-containing protein [Legionella tucsonensis]
MTSCPSLGLSSHGITPQFAKKYCQSQWLVKLEVGVYYRAGP